MITRNAELHKAMFGGTSRKPTGPPNADIELAIIDAITESGEMRPSELADQLGTNKLVVGRTVASSSKLIKHGNLVALA